MGKSKADRRWDEAVDWLLNSRHTADPDIQSPFWAYVDGLITREELNTFNDEQVRERKAERGLDPDTEQPVELTPSALEGAPPVRTYRDGSQQYGPYN